MGNFVEEPAAIIDNIGKAALIRVFNRFRLDQFFNNSHKTIYLLKNIHTKIINRLIFFNLDGNIFSMLKIAVVNGPNLNLVGTREQDIYGNQNLEDYINGLKQQFPQAELTSYQSNVEGELINYMHSCRGKIQGIVFNGGGYTHTSVAIADAIAAIDIPVVEVHISNIYAREDYRKISLTASKCVGCITGLGLPGYKLAIEFLIERLAPKA
jgi:3-dehydroquinate dehydratase-2